MTPTTTQLPNNQQAVGTVKIQENTVLFRVTRSSMGQQKKLDAREINYDADKDLLKVSKVVLDCPEVSLIKQLDGEIVTYLNMVALPSPFARGIYLLNIFAAETVDAAMTRFKEKRQRLVDSLVNNYDRRVEEQRSRLRAAFDQADYPPAESVRGMYRLTWQYISLVVPNQLPPVLQETERVKMEGMWQEAIDGVQQLLRANLMELMDHLQERLTPTPGAQKEKIFRDSAVQNLRDFLELFTLRNVTDDKDMERIVTQVQTLMEGVEPDALRKSSSVKMKVRAGFDQIKKDLDLLIVDAPTYRRVNLDD